MVQVHGGTKTSAEEGRYITTQKEKEAEKRKCCSWLFLHGNQRKWTKFLKDERLKRFLKDIR
jgi:hypothetical protein